MARKAATKVPVPPTLGEDAAERKRVLNILAQRRYRKFLPTGTGLRGSFVVSMCNREEEEGASPGARVSG
jgi:hypothetical protein